MNKILKGFRGLFTTEGLDAPNGFSPAILNVRLGDSYINPRYGYRNLAGAQASFLGAYGFQYLNAYTAAYANVTEWLSIENIGGNIKPFSVNPTTAVRTEIKSGTTAQDLDAGDWRGFTYDANAYLINPDSDKTLYRHAVGDATSWDYLQDTTYVAPPPDQTCSVTVPAYSSVPFDALDTIVVTSTNGIAGAPGSTVVNGAINATGSDNDNGVPQKTKFVVTYNATKNYSGSDYICLEVVAGDIFDTFITQSTKPRIKIGGVWSDLTDYHQYVSTDRTKYFIVAYVKGLTLTAVQGIEFSCAGHVVRFSSGTACTFRPVILGGTYIEASSSGHRVYDDTLDGDGVTYGVRYATVAGPVYTAIVSASLTSSQAIGEPIAASTCSIGAKPYIATVGTNSAPWVTDATGLVVVIQFLRLMEDGVTWKILGTAPNTDEQTWTDTKEENQLSALTTASTVVYTPPVPAPAFSTRGLIGGFPYKGWVIWLFKGGKSNIQHSRVGDAEETFSDSATYDTADLTRPENFTLADNFADEPVGGTQAGQVAIILGKQGVYAQFGDNPSNMTPPRKVPGSMGCAGRFAFARFRSDTGDPGVAFVDVTGENVWFVGSSSVFSGDTQTRPTELTSPIRGFARRFLLDEQADEFSFTDMSPVRMDVDEATNSLWITMGRRALVLRPASPVDSARHWEAYEYALQPPGTGGSASYCTDYASGTSAASAVRTSWTDDFSGLPYGLDYDGVYTTATPLSPGDITKLLEVTGIAPVQPIPANATVTGATLQIIRYADDTTPGAGLECGIIDDFVKVTKSGSAVSSNLSNGVLVPETPTAITYDFDPVGLGISLDDINNGLVGANTGWDAPGTSHTYDIGNWTIGIAPTSPVTQTGAAAFSLVTPFIVTATYIGAGSPPPYVVVSLTGSAVATGRGADLGGGLTAATSFTGTATVDDGLGATDSGSIASPTADPPPEQRSASSSGVKYRITLSGSSGTKTITMSSGVSVSGSHQWGQITHTLSGLVVAPDNATLYIDSIRITYCYTVPTSGPSLKLSFLSFSPLRKLWTLRSNGMIDELEWNSVTRMYIEGTNRDGGLTMPAGYWQSPNVDGVRRRLRSIGVDRSASGSAPTLTATCDQGSFSALAIAGLRWIRLPATQVGWWHYVRVSMAEGDATISALQFDEIPTSQGRTR